MKQEVNELIPKLALYSKLIRVSELFLVIRISLIILNSIFGEAVLSYGIGSTYNGIRFIFVTGFISYSGSETVGIWIDL